MTSVAAREPGSSRAERSASSVTSSGGRPADDGRLVVMAWAVVGAGVVDDENPSWKAERERWVASEPAVQRGGSRCKPEPPRTGIALEDTMSIAAVGVHPARLDCDAGFSFQGGGSSSCAARG
jgi:hypothetical protein